MLRQDRLDGIIKSRPTSREPAPRAASRPVFTAPMTPLLALDQALNFLLPAWGLGLLMALASKVFLRRALKRVSW